MTFGYWRRPFDVLRVARIALAAVSLAACNRDQPTTPLPLHPLSGGATHTIVTTLGTYSIPIPPNTGVNDGTQPVTNTSIIVHAGTYYRVRVNGTTTVTRNDAFATLIAPSFTFPLVGTYGPGGADSWSSLRVQLKARNTNGSGTNNINLPNLSYGTTAPDSARSDILFAGTEIEIQAGRNGLGCSGNNNQGSGVVGCYLLSASQTVTVEAITDVAHVAAVPNPIHPNQQVTFTASRDDGGHLDVNSWHWQPDPGAAGSASNPCGWNNPCQMNVAGSGTMTAYTTVGVATAHVTVYTNFTLDAVPATVPVGAMVTFTPRLDGAATPAARWKWKPSGSSGINAAPCPSGASTCTRAVMSNGTMWAYLSSSSGTGDSASAIVTVTIDSTAGSGGATPACPPDALCANATLHVIRGDGVTGSQIPADGSTYPINTPVSFSFSADAGYREIALVVDDTGRATTGTISMDHDHTIEVQADSNYLLNPDIAAISERLSTMVGASDAPAAFSDFLNWYGAEGTARGWDAIDHAIDVADYMTFDVGRDSAALNHFDEALGGVVFQILRAGASTNFEFMRPGDYTPGGITSRRPGRGATLSVTPASNLPTIVYINGISTTSKKARTSYRNLRTLVQETSIASMTDVTYMYNPTFAEEIKPWRSGLGCAARAEQDLRFTAPLIAALHYGLCKNATYGKWMLLHDFPESISQLLQIRYHFAGPKPQFVANLGNYMAMLHRLGDATLFVTHSQGNMMVSQVLSNLAAFENPQRACIAELTLASPIGSTHFPMPGRFLAGLSIKYDILQLLTPDTDNDFTPFGQTDISFAAEQAFLTPTSPAELLYEQADWGVKIHEVNHNYFEYPDSRTAVKTNLENLFDACRTSWP